MAEEETKNDYRIEGIFPIPVYLTQRDSNLDLTEEKEIEDVIEEGMRKNKFNSISKNSYIFDTKLFHLKEFIEKHIKTFVKQIMNPKREVDFYITQSWLTITKPGEYHHIHSHPNSIISGAFYVSTVENDAVQFHDGYVDIKERIKIEPLEYNSWNSNFTAFHVANNVLILFPSWMQHGSYPNKNATTERICLSFNVFAKGNLGKIEHMHELIL